MTPTAEWYEADADDSDRSITYDVTANTPERARAAETGETGARVHGDADLLRKRTAALDRVAAENERLRGEVRELRDDLNYAQAAARHWHEGWQKSEAELSLRSSMVAHQQRRAEATEAKLRGVEALIDSWPKYRADDRSDYGRAIAQVRDALRVVLARSQAPQAPADEEGDCGNAADRLTIRECQRRPQGCGCFPAPSVRPATADDEGVRRG